MLKWSSLLLGAALLAAPLSGCSLFLYPKLSAQEGGAASGAVLNRVKTRGRLSCGVSGNLPGFSYVTQQGEYNGLDVDILSSDRRSDV